MSEAAGGHAAGAELERRAGWMTRGGPRAAGRRWAILVVATATVLLVAAWLYDQMTWVTVDDARVATDMVAISSRVPGGVVSVRVISGDHAAKGQLLVELDGRDARLRIEELEARLAGMALRREELRARLRMIDMRTASKVRGQAAAVTQAQALLAGAQANEDLAQRDARRAEQLAPGGAIGRDQLDRARAALETARQQVRGSVANLETNRSSSAQAQAEREEVKVLARQLAQLDPEEAELRAQRERATLDLKERTVVMPFDGVVDRTFVHAGEYVVAGQRLLLAHDPRAVRVEANVKETDIRHFRPGKKVSVRVDALPGETFEGTVQRVGQAATSEFALLPSPNPSGNFTKITQRLPVRISVARRDGALKPGMMVQVEANTRE